MQHLGLVQSLAVVRSTDVAAGPKISDALETYLELKGSG